MGRGGIGVTTRSCLESIAWEESLVSERGFWGGEKKEGGVGKRKISGLGMWPGPENLKVAAKDRVMR